jgi:hypothetical protein
MTFFDIVDGGLAFENHLKSIKRVGGRGAMATSVRSLFGYFEAGSMDLRQPVAF